LSAGVASLSLEVTMAIDTSIPGRDRQGRYA
jgi:hypothetical protein